MSGVQFPGGFDGSAAAQKLAPLIEPVAPKAPYLRLVTALDAVEMAEGAEVAALGMGAGGALAAGLSLAAIPLAVGVAYATDNQILFPHHHVAPDEENSIVVLDPNMGDGIYPHPGYSASGWPLPASIIRSCAT